MKIRSKIALMYVGITAVLLFGFASLIYVTSVHNREEEFFQSLKKEGVSKASLFFESKASTEVLHSIYRNNIEYIDEVEIAIYDTQFKILYHDDAQIDIVKETPELLQNILVAERNVEFYEDKYQAVGFIFKHNGQEYIVTAAAYDGYGFSKLVNLQKNLFLLSITSLLVLLVIGYYLAKRALNPVSNITDKMKEVMDGNLFPQIDVENERDEIGELATQVNKALNIIEQSYESQRMFISNVSHELRTPLATLIGEIDIALLKERTNDEYKQILINSQQDTDRLIKLINGLLDLARANYDEKNIAMSEIRVDEVLLDAREIVLKNNKEYLVNLVFNQDIEDDSFITIHGNEYLLKTAFINLIENNCKFSDNKTSTVSISFTLKKLFIQFADNGVGINQEDKEHIFTPFYRGENRKYSSGHGIGMALVKRVVDLHKGRIIIHSVLGEGTIFSLEFKTKS